MNTVFFDKAADRRAYHGHVPSKREIKFARDLDALVRRSIIDIQEVISERERDKSKRRGVSAPQVSYDQAQYIAGIPRMLIGAMVSAGTIAGNKKNKTVSLSSLMAWKGLRDEKKMAA